VPKQDTANRSEFEPWLVRVKPGYILGPYGDEILLDCARIVDLRKQSVTGITGEPCVDVPDPWCSDVYEAREPGPLFVAVRYKEFPARPVRVEPIGCGCDDTRCEYSRWQDGYEIRLLTYCPPASHAEPPDFAEQLRGPIPDCPPCPSEPWVWLAKIELDSSGRIEKIDNCACRRMVASLGHFWWQCRDKSERWEGGHPREIPGPEWSPLEWAEAPEGEPRQAREKEEPPEETKPVRRRRPRNGRKR
jgi:hypothetical protein